MNEIEKLNIIAEWQEQYKQLIEDLDNSKKRIADLEKENAELKAESDFYNKERGNYKALFLKANLKNNKAKEIIKTLADDLSVYSGNYQKELLEAEQFLNSEVEK